MGSGSGVNGRAMREPWTKEDLKDLAELSRNRDAFGRLNWGPLLKRFPGRTKTSISCQISKTGCSQSLAWTREEDNILRDGWNDSSLRTLLSKLPGRSKMGLYERAKKLGLSAGPPQGMVSIKALSEDPKWGYDYYKTLKILRETGVVVRRFGYAGKKQGVRYVDQIEAMEAAKEWEARRMQDLRSMEFPRNAAKRLRVRVETLWRWLTEAGLVPARSGSTKRQFQALPEVFDRIALARRSKVRASRSPK